MLHDYGEFNTFVDHVLAIMEDQINDEPDKVEIKRATKTRRQQDLNLTYSPCKVGLHTLPSGWFYLFLNIDLNASFDSSSFR